MSRLGCVPQPTCPRYEKVGWILADEAPTQPTYCHFERRPGGTEPVVSFACPELVERVEPSKNLTHPIAK